MCNFMSLASDEPFINHRNLAKTFPRELQFQSTSFPTSPTSLCLFFHLPALERDPPYTAVPHLALPDLPAPRPPLTFSPRPAKLHEDNLVPLSCINLTPQFVGGLGAKGNWKGLVDLPALITPRERDVVLALSLWCHNAPCSKAPSRDHLGYSWVY
ncbi:hypothetical protein E2C01_100561 [Portunus trituberculatus]|uniref:Uncharacterized protein n=1 Tax=Portunus trituberculatus TaxID=210409 RepID=A0A5B7KCI9_PORTR|nr:hypothetical protein [Portunus trituberculatus]